MITSYIFVIAGLAICVCGIAIAVSASYAAANLKGKVLVSKNAEIQQQNQQNRRFLIDATRLGRYRGLVLLLPGGLLILFGILRGFGTLGIANSTKWHIYQTHWVTDIGTSLDKYEGLAMPYKYQSQFESTTDHIVVFFYIKASKSGMVEYRWTQNGTVIRSIKTKYVNGFNDVRIETNKGYLPVGKHKVEIVESSVGLLAEVEFVVGSIVSTTTP